MYWLATYSAPIPSLPVSDAARLSPIAKAPGLGPCSVGYHPEFICSFFALSNLCHAMSHVRCPMSRGLARATYSPWNGLRVI